MAGRHFCAGVFLVLAITILVGCVKSPPAGRPVTAVAVTASTSGPVNRDAAVTFTVVFDQAMAGFDDVAGYAQLDHDGTAGGQITVSAVDDRTCMVTVTGVTGDGSYTLTVPQGAAKDAMGNDSPAGTSNAVAVDNTAPKIVSVNSSTPSGHYGVGTEIDVAVGFSEPVALSGGTMTIMMNTGRAIVVQPFSAALEATGTYTVQAGDNVAAFDATSISLAGGAKADDAAGNALQMQLPSGTIAGTSTIVIDTTAPTVAVDSLLTRDLSPALSGTVDDAGATIAVTVAGGTFAAVNNGDGTWALAAGQIQPPLAYGTYDVAVEATDATGNIGHDATTGELKVATPPVISNAIMADDNQSIVIIFDQPIYGDAAATMPIGVEQPAPVLHPEH